VKILLDSDAAVFIAGTSLCDDFYSELPAHLTRYCFNQEIPGLRKKPRPHIRSGAQDVLDRVRDGDIGVLSSTVKPTGSDEDLYIQLKDKHDLDAGELSILRCLFWDSSNIAVTAAQDSDAREAITTVIQETSMKLQVGSPATVLGLLVAQQDSLTVSKCLTAMKEQVEREGWNWDEFKPGYEAEINAVLPD